MPEDKKFAEKMAARKARKEGRTVEIDTEGMSEEELAQLERQLAIRKTADEFKFGSPANAKQKIKIFFDDSGSMHGKKIEDAKKGTIEFMRNCPPNETAISIVPLNDISLDFTCNLPNLALRVNEIRSKGSTPLYQAIQKHIVVGHDRILPNRCVVFSDGEPDGGMRTDYNAETGTYTSKFGDMHLETIKQCQDRHMMLDTCWIAPENYDKNDNALLIMKDLAEKTGGISLVFEEGKVDFKHAFPFLTPGMRHLLMDDNFRERLQKGEV